MLDAPVLGQCSAGCDGKLAHELVGSVSTTCDDGGGFVFCESSFVDVGKVVERVGIGALGEQLPNEEVAV